MRSPIPALRNHVLREAARILARSSTFRRHLGRLDPNLDPDFLRAVALIRNASDEEAVFVRDLVSERTSFAQIKQDLWVLHETRRKTGGYFVEFGAADGISLSNTYLLERDFAWQGILVEPNPVWHAELARTRKAIVDFRCVYRTTGARIDFAATRHAALGTITEFIAADGHARSRSDHQVIQVETVRLGDLLRSHGAPRYIDYISIDTEGSELEILQAFDFAEWDVMLLSVEHNGSRQAAPLDRLMDRNGYERRYPGYSSFEAWYRKRGTSQRP
jgi:FkbM family methyltransferase